MTPAEFNHSVHTESAPPPDLHPALAALWWLAKGDWDRAHALAQEEASPAGSRVHAHLHRAEGDAANAAYWYRRAGREPVNGPLMDERATLLAALLDEQSPSNRSA